MNANSSLSVFSPRTNGRGSPSTTPETESSSVASSVPEILVEDKSSTAFWLDETHASNSIPYGKRLIPQIMDSLATAEPERIVFSLTMLSGNSVQFKHISASTFTKAVDKTAWWLHNLVGTPDSIKPVGYIGPRKLSNICITSSI